MSLILTMLLKNRQKQTKFAKWFDKVILNCYDYYRTVGKASIYQTNVTTYLHRPLMMPVVRGHVFVKSLSFHNHSLSRFNVLNFLTKLSKLLAIYTNCVTIPNICWCRLSTSGTKKMQKPP